MDPNLTIEIACQGYTKVPIDELNDLQGNLKDLTEENYVRLRNSMTQYGFSFPVFMWVDSDGKKWVMDAHQRLRTLRKMKSEGWTIPDLPADIIQAKDKIEAKKKLLLLNSRYGKMTREGFDEFVAEVGFEVPSEDIESLLVLPEEDIESLLVLPEIEIHDQSEEKSANDNTDLHSATCPNCGHTFNI